MIRRGWLNVLFVLCCSAFLGAADGCEHTITIDIEDDDGDDDDNADVQDDQGDDTGDVQDDQGDDDNGDGDGDGDGECESDADCPDGFYCDYNVGVLPCFDDNGDGACDEDADRIAIGFCLELPNDPCSDVDCGPGSHCEVQVYCYENDCMPDSDNCGGGECFEEAICVADQQNCLSDEDCPAGTHCERFDVQPMLVCIDEDGDGECDDYNEGGICVEDWIDECSNVACAEGEHCEVQTYCWDECDPQTGDCYGGCTTEAICVPDYNWGCENIDCGPDAYCELQEYCWADDCDPSMNDGCGGGGCTVEPVCVPYYYPTCEGVDCGPGAHCEETYYCMGACEPNGDCFEECYPEPICVSDEIPVECYDDSQCPAGSHCEWYAYAMPCYDENGDGQCDDLVDPMGGVCVPDQINTCAAVDCGPGYNCEEVTECYEICADGTDPNGNGDALMPYPCDVVCETFAQCVPEAPSCYSDQDCAPGEVCALEEICDPNTDGTDGPCLLEGKCIPVTDPSQCTSDADCGAGGACITETLCVDWCDQGVPDPECCTTTSYCAYSDPLPQ